MKTRRLFKENVYMRETEAVVTSLTVSSGMVLVTLDKTIFFPTGGGQSCDLGYIGDFEVCDVYEADDDIFHAIVCSTSDDLSELQEGHTVKLSLNWEHRFDNMQRHCGEHIMSGIFHREFGGVNRGFHMGEDYMTVDISLEDNADYDFLTWDMLEHVELLTNEVIWRNEPVITRHFDTKAEAENLPMRKKLTIENDITIVSVGSVDNPSDCVACCGTHPSSAGQVGLVKIFKFEPNKGMFRIYFEAGRRAFLKYQSEMDTLYTLGKKLSAGANDVLTKFDTLEQKNNELHNRVHHLETELVTRESAIINELLSEKGENSSDVLVRYYTNFSIDNLLALGKEVGSNVDNVLILVHSPSNTVLLFSGGEVDCNALVREFALPLGAKGGGSQSAARCKFENADMLNAFVNSVSPLPPL